MLTRRRLNYCTTQVSTDNVGGAPFKNSKTEYSATLKHKTAIEFVHEVTSDVFYKA